MAYKKIEITGVEVELRSSALTPYLFMNIFNQDLIKEMALMTKRLAENIQFLEQASATLDDSEVEDVNKEDVNFEILKQMPDEVVNPSAQMVQIVAKLGYVMNLQATQKDYKKFNMSTFYEWLDNFEAQAFQDDSVQNEIIECYSSNNHTELKKKND